MKKLFLVLPFIMLSANASLAANPIQFLLAKCAEKGHESNLQLYP